MPTTPEIENLYRATVHEQSGEMLGNITQVYVDDADIPTYVEVSYGVVGLGTSLVPLHGSHLSGTRLTLGFPTKLIKKSPSHEPGKELPAEREGEILRHYGVDSPNGGRSATGVSRPARGSDGRRDRRVGDSRTDELRDPYGS